MRGIWSCGLGAIALAACTETLPTATQGPLLEAVGERLWVMGDTPGRQARFSADGSLLALSNAGGDVFVIRTADWRPVRRLKHDGGATSVDFSADKRLLYTAGYDGTVRSWDLASGRLAGSLPSAGATIWSMDLSPDGKRLAAGGEDSLVRVWRLDRPAAPPQVLRGHQRNVWEVRFNADGSQLASGSFDYTASLWDVASGRRSAVVRHEQAIVGLDYRPDGKMLATSGDDSAIRLWSATGAPQRAIPAGNHVYKVAFSGDGRWLASAGRARSGAGTALYQMTGLGGAAAPVKLWRVSDGALVAALPHPTDVMGIAFSPDGRHVVTSDDDGRARLWRVSARP